MATDKEATKQRMDQPHECTSHISPKSLLIVSMSKSGITFLLRVTVRVGSQAVISNHLWLG
jgi:hypothetical protein